MAEGADIVLLSPTEIAARFPWMATDGVALGSLGLTGEGWFDGYGLMQAFRRKARSLGADFVTGEVVGLDVTGGRVTSVRLGDGTAIAAGHVVDAAGPWSREIAAMAGVPLPVEARRRCVFGFDAQAAVPDCPLVIDTSGIWFRPEGEAFITAVSPPPEEDHDGLPLTVDHAPVRRADLAGPGRARARVRCHQASATPGPATTNTARSTGTRSSGRTPRLTNLLFATGFSGHGIQHAPAVGRAIAELVIHGAYTTLDLGLFAYERLVEGRRVIERNVIG